MIVRNRKPAVLPQSAALANITQLLP